MPIFLRFVLRLPRGTARTGWFFFREDRKMKRLFLFATVAALVAGAAKAEVTAQSVADGLLAEGYTRVELRVGPTQIKAEAINGTEKREVIVDRASGEILKSELETASARDSAQTGVSIRETSRDFLRADQRRDASDRDDDSDRDDSGRDRDRSDNDDSDDGRSGSDDGGRGSDNDSDDDDDDSDDDDRDDDDGDHGQNSGHD
jgi:hypothetical protein